MNMKTSEFLKAFQNLVKEVQELKKLQIQVLNFLQVNESEAVENSNQPPEWISVKQACTILGCSEVTLWKLRKENLIPFSRLKRTIRFKKEDVYNYLNQK